MKQELVNEIIEYDYKYALIMGMNKDGKWDREALEYLEIHRLNDILRDLKTFERNKQRLENGE